MRVENIFCFRLRQRRMQLGLKQPDVGARIGMSAATISSYEQGISFPPLDTVYRLAEALEVSFAWLVGLED